MKNTQTFIKDPYVKTSFGSQQELEDFLACCDPVTGYQYFLDHFFYIQHPTKGSMLYQPYVYQRELASTFHNYRYCINLLSRQLGKSTTAAGYLLWYAMFVPDSTILIAAHKYTGAQEIMQRIRYAYENCPDYIKAGVTTYNKGSLDFENGSRIVSSTTTENTGRGMSISLLYLDEFAFVRPSIASEFWTSITPTLATGGKAIITSTPNSDEDQFAQIWHGANKRVDAYGNETDVGVNGFRSFKALWNEHPDRDEAWAEQMRAQLGEERFRREMDCDFVSADETLINPITLMSMKGIDPLHKRGQIRWYQMPKKGNIYTVTLDPSLGTGSDPAAIQVFEANTTVQVAEWKHNKTPIQEQIKLLAHICNEIAEEIGDQNSVYYSVENNTVGEAALVSLANYGEHNIKGIFVSERGKKRKGFNTTNKSKLAACAKFKHLVESGKMVVNSKALITELKSFIASGGSYAAKIGDTDDLVMSALLAVRVIQQLGEFHVELDSQLREYDEMIAPMPFFASFGY